MKKVILFSIICLTASILLGAPYASSKDFSHAYSFEISDFSLTGSLSDKIRIPSVPEPYTMFLVGFGLFAAGITIRKRTIR